jgi:hypothetical protein
VVAAECDEMSLAALDSLKVSSNFWEPGTRKQEAEARGQDGTFTSFIIAQKRDALLSATLPRLTSHPRCETLSAARVLGPENSTHPRSANSAKRRNLPQ